MRVQSITLTTRSIDTAAFVQAVTGQEPSLIYTGSMCSFIFVSNILTRDALISFETGGETEGRLLLDIRGRLFQRLRGGRP